MSKLEEMENAAKAAGIAFDAKTAMFMLNYKSVPKKRRVGFVGYGFLGKNLVQMILEDSKAQNIMELAFVVDLMSPNVVIDDPSLPDHVKIANLDNWESYNADLIVEVAHPSISTLWGAKFLEHADYLLASTTAFADKPTEELLKTAANKPNGHGLYMAAGALFGSLDIQKMSDMGKLSGLRVVMKKHPLSLYPTPGTEAFHLNEAAKSSESEGGEVLLFDGTVRNLANLFPRNVNTICTAAIAAWSSVGMDNSTACVITDSNLEKMIIDVTLEGAKDKNGKCLTINIVRDSPAPKSGAVTSQATVTSFLASLLAVAGQPSRGDGLHLC
jgi:aspartate dehydrogenase